MTLLYGHRGARGEAPENTLPSFLHCLQVGVKRCELDLHLSRDGQLMVIHDPSLKRTTGRRGKVAEFFAADLTRLDARNNTPTWPEPCPIPTLESLFQACNFEHWQLEVKSASPQRAQRTVEAILALVTQHGLESRVTITSSSRAVLRAALERAPQLSRGLVAEYAWLDPIKVAQRYRCDYLVLNGRLCHPARIQRAHQAGLHVSAWTINDPALMQQLAAQGVDSLITDVPTLALAALGTT